MLYTDEDKKDEVLEQLDSLHDCLSMMTAYTKRSVKMVEKIIYVDGNGNDQVAEIYDYKTVAWNTTLTMDKLANKYFADPNMASLICSYNKIQDESSIANGTIIKIPVLVQSAKVLDNAIFAIPGTADNYGIDIALDDEGNFSTKDGDFDFVSGPENLNQAISNRLTTAADKRIRYTAYGIKSQIGDESAVANYLISSTLNTVIQDPRIQEVTNINVKGTGKGALLSIEYKDINGKRQTTNQEI